MGLHIKSRTSLILLTTGLLLPLPGSGSAQSDERGSSPPACSTERQTERPEQRALEMCNGLLKPPSVGDAEILNRPPKGGTMPIIRPKDLGHPNSR